MGDMAKIDLPYVQSFLDRHGRQRYYFRKPGHQRKSLPGAPGSSEFMAAYADARSAAKPAGAGIERTVPGTISALLVAYYASAEFSTKRASTQRGYLNMLERFRTAHGSKTVANIKPQHLDAIFEGMAATPGAARNLRKRLRRVFRLAVKLGWRDDNPVVFTDAPRTAPGGFTPWSEGDIAAFEARWPTGSRERLALALLLYTGQRRSDVVGMGRQHITAGRIRVSQLKTDAQLLIRIHPALKTEIDAAPKGMTLLLTQYGVPFSAAGFSQWFRERAEMAGLVGRTPHGLRKAAGRRLAEAGCSAKQIAAVLGHTSLSEVARYTQDADQTTLADAAISALRTKKRTAAVKPRAGSGQT